MTMDSGMQDRKNQRGELRRIQGREQAVDAVAHPFNRPGLDALAYRVGDYHRFRQKLMMRLSQPVLPGGSTLESLTTRATDDSAIALLDAWSIMADVLTFYQERIANEGFLNTATERLSVLELARSIGYELDPGVAASTYFSFEVEDPLAGFSTVEDPTVIIPQGTQVESVPGEGELPQLFETVEELVARPEWSTITARSVRSQQISYSANQLLINGIDTPLQPGSWLLLIEKLSPNIWQLVRLNEVTPDNATEQTRVSWNEVIKSPTLVPSAPDDSVANEPSTSEETASNEQAASMLWHQPQVFSFRTSARLFGADAPLWESLPGETKRQAIEEAVRQATAGGTDPRNPPNPTDPTDSPDPADPLPPELAALLLQSGVFSLIEGATQWLPLSTGLPDKDILSLLGLPDGTLLAGTAGLGIYRRRRGESSWRAANEGLTQLTIVTFFIDGENEDTTVYAGAGGGGIYRSKDRGDTWVAINSGSIRIESNVEDQWVSVDTGLPTTVVRAVGLLRHQHLFVGTDDGLYLQYFNGKQERNWTLIPRSVEYAVRALQPNVSGDRMIVGTDQGLFEIQVPEPQLVAQIVAEEALRAAAEVAAQRMREQVSQSAIAAAADAATTLAAAAAVQSVVDAATTAAAVAATAAIAQSAIQTVAGVVAETEAAETEADLNAAVTQAELDVAIDAAANAVSEAATAAATQAAAQLATEAADQRVNEFVNSFIAQLRERANSEEAIQGATRAADIQADAVRTAAQESAQTRVEQSWVAVSTPPELQSVQTLIRGDGYLLAGTTTGLYWQNGNAAWQPIADSTNKSIRAIALTNNGERLLAATSVGNYVWIKRGNDWALEDSAPQLSTHILSLTAHNNTVYAGSRFVEASSERPETALADETIVGSGSSSNSRDETSDEASNATTSGPTSTETIETSSVRPSAERALPPPNWPNFKIQKPNQIDFDTLYPQVVAGSQIALIDEAPEQIAGTLTQITTAKSVPRKAFGLDTQLTRLQIAPALENADLFSLRTTQVLAQAEQLPLALEPLTVEEQQHNIFRDPLRGKQIFLSQYVAHLQPQQPVLIRGKHMQAEVMTVGGIFKVPLPVDSTEGVSNHAWQVQNAGLTTTDIRALVVDSDQKWLYAGTDEGVFRAQLPDSDELDSDELTSADLLWRPMNQGLLNRSVQALVVDNNRVVYVGTADGIFALTSGQTEWRMAHVGLLHPNVQSLVTQDGALYAATSVGRDVRSPRGVFQLDRDNNHWRPTGLTNVDIQALAIHAITSDEQTTLCLLAGTHRQGLFRSDNGGNSWRPLPQWKDFSGVLESDDTEIIVTATQVRLSAGDKIRASGQIRTIVRQSVRPGARPSTQSNEATGTVSELGDEMIRYQIDEPFKPDLLPDTPFSLGTGLTNPNVTALLFDGAGEEGREPVIFAGTAGSGVFFSKDGGDRWQKYRKGLSDLEIRCLAKDTHNRLWVGTQLGGIFYRDDDVSGSDPDSSPDDNPSSDQQWHSYRRDLYNTDVKAILPLDHNSSNDLSRQLWAAGSGLLINAERTHAVALQLGDHLHVVRPPQSNSIVPSSDTLKVLSLENGGRWTMRDRDGFVGHLTTNSPTDLNLLPAAETDPWVSEKGQVDYPPEDQRQPILTLAEPLQYSYDPATVTVSANVVLATHGETIEETLGSGDGTRSHQHFTLNQPPLTYTASTGSTGTNSSLSVRVNGVLWQEVASLYGREDNDPVYFVRLDDDGTPHITFGDGSSGTRLPSGLENITAIYRTGIGPEGEVDAERLTLPKTKPLGMVAVNNPLPATGAAPPESMQTARTKAPATLRTLDRIVSLSDFEDFARGYPGIGKARSLAVWTPNRVQWVQLTIAGMSDASGFYKPLDDTAPLYAQLVAAIDHNRDPIQQVQVNFCELLQFNLAAKVLIDSSYLPETVMTQVRQSLRTTFAFDERAFGQAVTASEVIAAIQTIEGVVAVDLDALYQVGQSKRRRNQLPAEVARWDREHRKISPAQLLLLSRDGIELEAVERL